MIKTVVKQIKIKGNRMYDPDLVPRLMKVANRYKATHIKTGIDGTDFMKNLFTAQFIKWENLNHTNLSQLH